MYPSALSAEFGKPFDQTDATDTITDSCFLDGDRVKCTVDARATATSLDLSDDKAEEKTLQVDYPWFCEDNFIQLPDPVSGECEPCPPGQVRITGVDAFCLPCNLGTYFARSDVGCLEAPAGTYVDTKAAIEFFLCPPYANLTLPEQRRSW